MTAPISLLVRTLRGLRAGSKVLLAAVAGFVPLAAQSTLPRLWLVPPPPGAAHAEQALLASAQGNLNREQPTVWIHSGGLHGRVLDRVASRFNITPVESVWALLASNRSAFSGFLTCHVTNHTLNLATSLAGPRRALVVDATLRERALTLGLAEVADLRQESATNALERFGAGAARGLLIHQPVSKPFHLRDLAVARNAWVDFPESAGALTGLVRDLGPDTEVLGWGRDEHDFVRETSRGGGWVIPADWALNLSAHRWIHDPAPASPPPPTPAPAVPGQRIVCFVISDGDNVQWLLGGFTEQPGFWSSPRRGTFPVTWELAPRLADLAPAAFAWLQRTASPMDAFVGGPSGGGYHFPHETPDRTRIARRSADALAKAGLRITSVLNSGGNPDELEALLADPRIDGALYKDYAPYNRRRGAIRWIHGKPVAAYRHLLWEQLRPDGTLRPDWLPDGVARAIRESDNDATKSPDAFALVQVHAWSFRKQGGPLEAIHQTVQKLPSNTRVVSATEFLALLGALKPAPRGS